MTPTAIFLGATAMTTGAGADTDERPSERDAPGMKAEPMSEGTRSIVCVRRRKSESAPKDVRSSALSRGAIIKYWPWVTTGLVSALTALVSALLTRPAHEGPVR